MSQSMPGLRRGLALLEHLSKNPEGYGFNKICETFSGLAPATCNRLLRTLQEENFIIQQNKKYTLSTRAKEFGANLTERLNWDEHAQHQVNSLARSSGHSAAFFQLGEKSFRLFSKNEIDEGFHYIPVDSTSSAFFTHSFDRVLTATMPLTQAKTWLKKSQSDQTMLTLDKKELEEFGALSGNQNNNGPYRIAAPVYRKRPSPKNLIGSIGITMIGSAPHQKTKIELLSKVIEHAKALSEKADA